ncbi:alpha/beta fold hydrolase (macronuclear) [Tetrahymena thermophila SB210]|uniref:Alpha/beta fold hydrolase n=1 Tax=Tetrahymena thermophila (strain SB210) TaxID=312017 RepID=I7M5X8_TETTS|nr:alpha/beta fold hydrolase [Tetrahymena thermophila SB210]EAR83776.1 alpha/beta fold hydrolase [Tetrahymena thermophila SB210]|eukprot:XP_001031439.1 alpha/beta fold hydrolase [Tetrahymena thermophila SB210]
MKLLRNAYRFGNTNIAQLKDYKYPSLDSKSNNNIIWLHGMFDSSRNFLNIAEQEEIRKLGNQTLLDARNHGFSQHTDVYTVQDMVNDFIEYLANRDMKNLYIIGHSMGGRTVLSSLSYYKQFLLDRVKGIIIIDTIPCSYTTEGIFPIDSVYRYIEEVKSLDIKDKTFQEIEQQVRNKFEQPIANSILINLDVLENGQVKWLNNFPIIEKSFDKVMSHEIKDVMWSGPRKILIGNKSRYTSKKLVQELYPTIFSDFKYERDVVEFEHSGHFPYIKEPQKFIEQVVQFIQQVENDQQNQQYKKKYYDESLTYDI